MLVEKEQKTWKQLARPIVAMPLTGAEEAAVAKKPAKADGANGWEFEPQKWNRLSDLNLKIREIEE